jgi:hypothetical protein
MSLGETINFYLKRDQSKKALEGSIIAYVVELKKPSTGYTSSLPAYEYDPDKYAVIFNNNDKLDAYSSGYKPLGMLIAKNTNNGSTRKKRNSPHNNGKNNNNSQTRSKSPQTRSKSPQKRGK